MLNNLLNTLSFGSVVQQNGKSYLVIMRLTDRLFVAKEQNAVLPAPLMLVQVDIQMNQPQPGSEQGQAVPVPGPAPASVPAPKPAPASVPAPKPAPESVQAETKDKNEEIKKE